MTGSAIREAIERTSAAIAADPAKATAKNVPATARLADGLKFEVTGPYGERLSWWPGRMRTRRSAAPSGIHAEPPSTSKWFDAA
jgi:hypothetical protein